MALGVGLVATNIKHQPLTEVMGTSGLVATKTFQSVTGKMVEGALGPQHSTVALGMGFSATKTIQSITGKVSTDPGSKTKGSTGSMRQPSRGGQGLGFRVKDPWPSRGDQICATKSSVCAFLYLVSFDRRVRLKQEKSLKRGILLWPG